MSLTYAESIEAPINPLDLVEELVGHNEWAFDRASIDELAVEIDGRWSGYRLFFLWQQDMGALHFSCIVDCKVPSERRRDVEGLLALINEKLWLGHFDVPSDEATPMFRHTLLLRGARTASAEQMEDLVEVCLTECERFFPAFQFVIWGGKSPAEAMQAALIDVVGEA